jgi:Domain of unknown function (DUF4158)
MPPRTLLSSEQRTRLFAIPTDAPEMIRHYVLDADDLALVGARRRAGNRLGFAVQLCALRHPGRVLDPSESPPPPMLAFVARQIGVDPALFGEYARRAETRREHLLELQRLLRLQSFGLADWRACFRVGMDAAWATDRGEPIVQAMLTHLRASGVLLPVAAVRANRPGCPCSRAKEDLRDARGRAVRFGTGYAHGATRGRSRAAPLPLRLAAGLFGVARALQHRRAVGASRICAQVGNRSFARRTYPRSPPRPADR